ncbi:MAG: hypothetical protein KGR19_01365 [Acidobacteria bacterium]|nr:hypothetical protein [Solirubrobacteraceae bacterium]MBU6336447.1 hypothetical protein [Acidobacteriota bacterium]
MAGERPAADPRKVERRYTEGDLVRVAGGRNQAEADLIAGLLLEEGIPSLVRRSPAADVPEMLAAGSRDVLVPRSALEDARQVLLESGMALPAAPFRPSPLRLGVALAAALAVLALVAWLVAGG